MRRPVPTANFKKSYVDVDKTDPIDAFVIADRLRWGRDIGTPFEYDESFLALRFLTRYRYHVVGTRVAIPVAWGYSVMAGSKPYGYSIVMHLRRFTFELVRPLYNDVSLEQGIRG